MTRWQKGPPFVPSPQAIAMVRERLERMGLPVTEAMARSLVEALLACEGPRLYAQAQSNLENSLEIIRDTAESALSALHGERSAPNVPTAAMTPTVSKPPPVATVPTAKISDRPAAAPRRPQVLEDGLEDDEPRPVFKRPRR
ncbi:MAG TPA: hypothetical protein VGP44_12275 [Gemmatimonadales bacterium]|nr:hypothetical protein [Gemmatimonadales bacterium]